MTVSDPIPLRRARRLSPHHVRFSEPRGDAGLRLRQSRLVRRVYAEAYGAQLDTMMPWLLSLHGPDDTLAGVVGARPAACGPLFLESYLDVPIETALAAAAGEPVWRDTLVEVGNLAAAEAGVGRLLIASLASLIEGTGGRWAVFTATSELRALFARLGVELVDIAPADGARLGRELVRWGSYYETAPRVSAARIDDVRAACDSDRSTCRAASELCRRARVHGWRLATEAVA